MTHRKQLRAEKIADTEPVSSAHEARRRLISGGIAAGAAIPFLPGAWTRPVVQSVLLPAHAQTSSPEPPCAQADTLPDMERTCGVLLGNDGTRYNYELVDGCLVRTTVEAVGSPAQNQIDWVINQSSQLIALSLDTQADSIQGIAYDCSTDETSDTLTSMTISVGGNPYLVTYTHGTEGEEPTVFIRDILVSPAT